MNISCSKGTDSNLETSWILQSYGIQYIQIKYLQATAANSRFVLALGSHLSMPIPIMERDPATLAGKQTRGHGQAHPQDSTLVSVTVHQQKVPAGLGGCIFSHIMPGSSNCRRFLDSYQFSFTGGTLLQLPPVHTVIFLLENTQMKSYVCIYWTVQNVMEPANIMKIEPGPTCIKFRALLGPAQKYQ